MDIATTSSVFHLFPTDQRFKTKLVDCKPIDFSDISSLHMINPKLDTYRDRNIMAAPKKRQHFDEENPPNKRQKNSIQVDSTSKAKSIKAKVRRPVEKQNRSFRDLITKAKTLVQEKRQIDHRKADIASQRVIARLAVNNMVATVDFDDHPKYHRELEQLGCTFIHDQVDSLNMFSLLSRSDYTNESNSVLGESSDI